MEKICVCCNNSFVPKNNRQIICESCRYIYLICQECGKTFKAIRSKYIYKISKNPNAKIFCSNFCQRQQTYRKEAVIKREENKRKRWNNLTEKEKDSFLKKSIHRPDVIEKTKIASHTKDIEQKRFETKKKNGYYDNEWRNIIKRGHTKEACKLQWETKKSNPETLEMYGKIWEKARQIHKLSIEEFYKSSFKKIFFNSLNLIISYNEINNLKGIPGVWSKSYIDEYEKEVYLDVSQTKDIGKEMLFSIRALEENKNKEDSELKPTNLSLRKKYRDMYEESNGKIIFKVICKGIELKAERELIEMQFAHDVKAKYWRPAPGQQK